MLGKLGAAYTKTIHENLRQYATWPIGSDLGLGDYGLLDGHWFIKYGNINDLSITYKPWQSETDLSFEFKSSGIEEARIKAAASAESGAAATKASVRVHFSSDDSVYFRSIRLTYSCFENFPQVAAEVMKGFEQGKWDGKW